VAKLLRATRREGKPRWSPHREAPSISKDPVADNNDTYAWVTPGKTVTIVTNYVPGEIRRTDRTSTSSATTSSTKSTSTTTPMPKRTSFYSSGSPPVISKPEHVLVQHRPITSLTQANWNRRQR